MRDRAFGVGLGLLLFFVGFGMAAWSITMAVASDPAERMDLSPDPMYMIGVLLLSAGAAVAGHSLAVLLFVRRETSPAL